MQATQGVQARSEHVGIARRSAVALSGAGYRLVREEVAATTSNKTVGAGIRRFYFEKTL
jgi:hypothetical protein